MDVLSVPFIYVVLGYLSGSVLYSELFMRVFHGKSLMEVSENHNPGSSNAFIYGGFWCGALSVVCDIAKGLLPVRLFCRAFGMASPMLALVMAAPVLGHARPCFFGFKGGMCIATSFGVLLGLLPCGGPFIMLAALYLGFYWSQVLITACGPSSLLWRCRFWVSQALAWGVSCPALRLACCWCPLLPARESGPTLPAKTRRASPACACPGMRTSSEVPVIREVPAA